MSPPGPWLWICRSLRFHRALHLSLAAGAALTTAILAAALLTGEALQRNLRRIALQRVGGVRSAIELPGRTVDAALAERLAARSGMVVAPVLRVPASLIVRNADGTERRVDRVETYGVDKRFAALAPGTNIPPLPRGERVWWSPRLAEIADPAAVGSTFALRVARLSPFPADLPLGGAEPARAARQAVVAGGILPEESLGRFALAARPLAPRNLFAELDWLAAAAGAPGQANLLLSAAEPAALAQALRTCLTAADVGVRIARDADGVWRVRSDRVHLDAAHTRLLEAAIPRPVLALHHLADSFSAGGGAALRETPYGFITALTPGADVRLGVVPEGMADDQIAINEWLAAVLRVGIGERLTLRWRRFEPDGRLIPGERTFQVARVLPMRDAETERDRMPRFPGLAQAERCADWDIGMPMDRARLSDAANEEYWKKHGVAPKAFVTLSAGREMLGTHFGSAMTARFPPEAERDQILRQLDRAAPESLGLAVRSLREEALRAAEPATDFRQLFAGMASVLMVSALLLTGLLAALGAARRRGEMGLLRALGFSRARITALWLVEALAPLGLGVAAGMAGGVGGAWWLVRALNHSWSGAVGALRIPFSVGMETCAGAGLLALGLAFSATACGARQALRLPVRELFGEACDFAGAAGSRRWVAGHFAAGLLTALAAVALPAGFGRGGGLETAGIFFASGLLLVAAVLCVARGALELAAGRASGPLRAGILNAARHRGRSLLVMLLLALGSFLTVGILAMKHDPAAHTDDPAAGSGGFGLMIETTTPLAAEAGRALVRERLGTNGVALALRVREGDEADCLNPQRVAQPRLLGVPAAEAEALRMFEPGGSSVSPWARLRASLPDGAIPALAADLTTLTYGLKARAGREFVYAGEDGAPRRVRVVGALPVRTGVLQGSLLLDAAALGGMYPTTAPARLWLVRTRVPEAEAAERLGAAWGRYGGVVTTTRARLRELGAVESAYLDMFLVLGGLGVALGAGGLGLLALRNAAARRGELALLRAVGLTPARVFAYLAAEHVVLLLAGLAAGVLPALAAVRPAARGLGQDLPVGPLAAVLGAMIVCGLCGALAGAWSAARLRPADALRGE